MGADLKGVKKQFAAFVDRINPIVLSHFIVWLDEKVSEFKVNGHMKLDTDFDAPSWIIKYSESILSAHNSNKTSHLQQDYVTEHYSDVPKNLSDLQSKNRRFRRRPVNARCSAEYYDYSNDVIDGASVTEKESLPASPFVSKISLSKIYNRRIQKRKSCKPSTLTHNILSSNKSTLPTKSSILDNEAESNMLQDHTGSIIPCSSHHNDAPTLERNDHEKNFIKRNLLLDNVSNMSDLSMCNSSLADLPVNSVHDIYSSSYFQHSTAGDYSNFDEKFLDESYTIDEKLPDESHTIDEELCDQNDTIDELCNQSNTIDDELHDQSHTVEAGVEDESYIEYSDYARMFDKTVDATCPDDFHGDIATVRSHVRRRNLQGHLERVLRRKGTKFPCMYCGEQHMDQNSLAAHLPTHLDNETSQYQCYICDTAINDVIEFIRHYMEHVADFKYKYTCTACGRRFSRSDNLRRHMKTFHNYNSFIT